MMFCSENDKHLDDVSNYACELLAVDVISNIGTRIYAPYIYGVIFMHMLMHKNDNCPHTSVPVTQSWALSAFLNFFTDKTYIFAFFIKSV